jgi:hypothetical protein
MDENECVGKATHYTDHPSTCIYLYCMNVTLPTVLLYIHMDMDMPYIAMLTVLISLCGVVHAIPIRACGQVCGYCCIR